MALPTIRRLTTPILCGLAAWPMLAHAQTVTYTPTLKASWNLLGNSLTTALDVKATFGNAEKFTTVWKWDPSGSGQWQFYSPSLDSAGTLSSYAKDKGYGVLSAIKPGEGYWVNVASAQGETLAAQSGTGFNLGPGNLVGGWNLAATGNNPSPVNFNRALTGATSGAPANVTTLWAWDNAASKWYFYSPTLDGAGTLASYISSKEYSAFDATTLGAGRGFWVNYPGCVFTPTWESSSSSLLSSRLKVSFENVSGASSPKGLKQRFLLENTSSSPLYLQLNASSAQGRIMLMAPQPSYVYLLAGGQYQGMLVFEAATTATAGSQSYTVSLSAEEIDLSSGKGSGKTDSASRDVSFTLTATSIPQIQTSTSTSLSYTRTQQVSTKTGFWTYAVDDAESKIVLFPGQETWADSSTKSLSTLYAYTLSGSLLWQAAAGNEIWGGDMSKDGNYVAYATIGSQTDPDNLVLLDGVTGSEIWRISLTLKNFPATLNAHLPSTNTAGLMDVREVRFSPSGKYLAIASMQGKVYLLDRATKTVLWGFETAGQVRGIRFSADESMLYAGSGDGFLHKLAVATGAHQWKSYIVSWPYTPATLSPDGKIIVSGNKTGEMVVIDAATGSCIANYDFGIMTVRKTVFSPDGKHLLAVTGAPGGSVSFDAVNWSSEWATGMSAGATITGDSAYALIAEEKGSLLEMQTGKRVATLDAGFATGTNYLKVIFISKDGSKAVIARRDTSPDLVNIAFFSRN